ncbi:hypothetical protein KAU33_16195 [Candidatus Dependentiae bacterium]|nr:hypothetical protein [Candidatus Dependentiae bacterium]
MNKRTRNKIFDRAQLKFMTDKTLTPLESEVWDKILKVNVVPHILECRIRDLEELLTSYILESEKMGPSCVPDDGVVYEKEIQTLKSKLITLKSSYNTMKKQRKYKKHEFKEMVI